MTEDIIKQIKQGSKAAFQQVFENYFNALSAFAFKYVKDTALVEDIIQEAFIGFWENKMVVENLSTVKAYLYTIVRNKSLNHLKHISVKQKNEASLIYELESEQFFTHNVIEEETFNQLYAEIKNLPEAARKIMLLALNGLKNKEIADELGVSENTVKTQKKIAYSKLKKNINPLLSAVLLSL